MKPWARASGLDNLKRVPDMRPIEIWIGCFIGSMLGVIVGEFFNQFLLLRRAKRLLRDL